MNEQEQRVHDAFLKLARGTKVEAVPRQGQNGWGTSELRAIVNSALERLKMGLEFDVERGEFTQEEATEIYEALITMPEIKRTKPDVIVAIYPDYEKGKLTLQSVVCRTYILH